MTDPIPSTANEATSQVEDLPQWAQDKLAKANAQAAKYRIAAKDAAENAIAGLRDEFASRLAITEAEALTATDKLVKMRVALQSGIPADKAEDFAALLSGSDEAALAKHASIIKSIFAAQQDTIPSAPPRATDSSQGQGVTSSHELTLGDLLLSKLN
jgi:hypothetical protein